MAATRRVHLFRDTKFQYFVFWCAKRIFIILCFAARNEISKTMPPSPFHKMSLAFFSAAVSYVLSFAKQHTTVKTLAESNDLPRAAVCGCVSGGGEGGEEGGGGGKDRCPLLPVIL